MQDAKVLVVDDHMDTAESVARRLRRRGCSVTVAHDGPTALEIAHALHPRFLLLDIGLPGMDGYELAVALRGEASCAGAIIVAISGCGQQDDYRRSKNVGFNHHLVKPVDFEQLESILSNSGKQGEEIPTAVRNSHGFTRLSIGRGMPHRGTSAGR